LLSSCASGVGADPVVWPFKSARDRLDDEAAEWVIRMRGPDRERYRAAFERWRSDPEHAQALVEASDTFSMAGGLREGELAAGRELPTLLTRRAPPLGYALAALVIGAIIMSVMVLRDGRITPPEASVETARYVASAGEVRLVTLPDGSRVRLSGGTVADMSFDRRERRIRLLSGRGRFAVAHESRPFRVFAGSTEVVARGTVFDVSFSGGKTQVALIEGSVDVSYQSSASGRERRVRHLKAGQQILVGGPERSASVASAPAAPAAAADMLQFDGTRLADAVAAANRGSRTKIRLADPSIADLRVTGAFRSGDAGALAESLAAAFRLRLERLPDGTALLHAN
jgi:transmembrane sensor